MKKTEEGPKIIKNEIAYVSHLDKIFDEILVNIIDNKQCHSTMTSIEVDINYTKFTVETSSKGYLKKIIYTINDCWDIGVAKNDYNDDLQQASFVNSILTSENGKHIDYITEQICPKLVEHIKKKSKAAAAAENLKPMQVENHLFKRVNCLIKYPEFESQAKQNKLATEGIIKKIGIVPLFINWLEHPQDAKLQKQNGMLFDDENLINVLNEFIKASLNDFETCQDGNTGKDGNADKGGNADEMYAEVCAFLTNNKYFQLPNYRIRVFLYYDTDININNVQ
ncbi:unnamed protein product [Rotaria sordida]|uniref:DNA topoisomerase (ATP-hydrolyzing) n=1 Tax=Rotaria sordida TaxID=392033 RepID=A0A819SI15_9BILA|nr:unnamed protein product [Rotaria sordida]